MPLARGVLLQIAVDLTINLDGGECMTLRQTADQSFLADVKPMWGWLLLLGILMSVAGVMALGSAVIATLATVWFLGIILLAAGVVDVVSAIATRGWRGSWHSLVTGVLAAVLGVLLITRPALGAGVLTLLLALVLLATGIGRAIGAVAERFSGWGWVLASGVVSIILGAFVIAQFPTSALWFLGIVVAVELLVRGATWIALALALHRAPELGERRAEPQAA
jgi:uncharacterized membrane protein HdeD (DUF308 family)